MHTVRTVHGCFLPLRAGLLVTLLQLRSGLDVFRVAVTMMLQQDLVGPDVRALCRVQLVAWNRRAAHGHEAADRTQTSVC